MKSKRRKADDTPFAAFGQQLENLRLQRGISQVQLAEAMGMGQSALSHLERRADIRSFDADRIRRFAWRFVSIEVKFRDGETIKLMDRSRSLAAADMSGLAEADRQMAPPAILGPEQRRPSRDVLFSIRPAHAEKILTGTNGGAARRFASAVTPGTLALIYSTSPTSALTGSAKIKAVQCTDLRTLWKTHRKGACLDKSDFEAYFAGLERGYAITSTLPARLNDRSD